MRISYSPKGIVNREHPGQGLADMAKAGFEKLFLDMSMYISAFELENQGGSLMQEERQPNPILEDAAKLWEVMEEFFSQGMKQKLDFSVALAPYLMRDTKRRDLNNLCVQLAEESIRVCGKAGCDCIVIRPLFAGVEQEDEWEINRSFYLELVPVARENGVMILLENQCRDLGGHPVRGICANPEEAAQWVDALNEESGEERFGFCMDVAVCNLCGQNMQGFANAVGERLKAVLLRDCDGHEEGARLPFTCVSGNKPQTDWLSLIRGLREIGFDGQLILDMSDTAGAFSPLLRPMLLELAKGVAEYFKWQIEIENLLRKYESIVLFGAGNMCRNYMKCYGEKYPPLFTCDNNAKMWGSHFCGLEVKSPEALRDLPEGCGVFICNVYYREIEEQLRTMGVKNIAFFNDEYMPTFFFDRLKGGM